MKKVLKKTIIPIFFVIALLFAAVTHARVFVNEGFEGNNFNGTPEGYIGPDGYCNAGGTECSVAAGTCANCAGVTNISEIQSSVVHSGSYALKGTFNSTAGAASIKMCGLDGNCGYKYNIRFPAIFWVRFYIKFDPALRFYHAGGPKVFERTGNMYLTMRGVTSTTNWGEADNTPYGAIGVYSSQQSRKTICGSYSDDIALIAYSRQYSNSDGSSWIIDLTNPDHLGWWYFEVMFDTTNNQFSLWVKRPKDATVTQVYNHIAWTFNGIPVQLDWLWYNDCGPGKGGGIYYLDDIVIADEYIGPTPPLNAPSPPSGLRIVPPSN